MKVTAKLNNLRIAPRKTKLVADLIRGLDVAAALDQLEAHVKRTSPHMKKLLESAIANGENNLGLDKSNLYVYDVLVGAGPTLKRWMPKAFGRAGQIAKRTSKLEIVLEERVEGKGRKTKEQMEQEKKKRLEEKKKAEKAEAKEREEKEKDREKEKETQETGEARTERTRETKNQEQGRKDNKTWKNRIFRRKSM
jgi:large subunit ribosomal protein L22